ncbi:MAG: glycoside hydrolase family 3 N-terminal domain-containing protein [Odoribacter sp.]
MKQRIIFIVVFFILSPNCFSKVVSIYNQDLSWIDSTLYHMTLNEKIGQLFMVAAYSNQSIDNENKLEEQIHKYHIGGLIFFQGEPIRQVKLTNRYQKASKYPLLIGMDAEHGIGWRLHNAMEFPKMLTNGAIRNDSLVYDLGATIANHCRELGVHINFAPVVDINSNPRNPIIGMRSFGEQPQEVVRKAIAYMQGSLSQNVLPVIKHFPGHGDTDSDSHHTLPFIRHSRQRLDSIELYPYLEMIKARVPAVMTSHLNIQALDSSGTPASLSPIIINHLLKKEWGFDGLCFTDAMNMKGVTQNTTPGKAEVKALIAGNDILLFPSNLEKAILEIKKAIKEGELSEEIITQKCRKILTAKYRYVLPNVFPLETPELLSRINTPSDLALKETLYKESITLIKNNDSLLPLKRLDTLRIASINFGEKEINHFQRTLCRYSNVSHFNIEDELSEEDVNNWKKKLKAYNCIILYNNACSNSSNKEFGYSASLRLLIQKLSDKRIILCHPRIPYGLSKYINLPIDAILLTYENHLYAQQYAAQGIFGGIAINGKLPVSINPQYSVGKGIQTQKTRLGYETPEMCGIATNKLSRIDSLCEMAIRTQATPGCQVLIAKDGKIFYNKAFGYHTYKKEVVNSIDDIYDIASVTKITSTLPGIMKLYDNREICLDAHLSDYYPPLEKTDKKDITVKEVLCHNAGLKTFLPLFSDAIDKKSMQGKLFTSQKTANNTLRLKDHLYMNLNYHFKDSTIAITPKPGYKYIVPGLYMFPKYQDSIINTILQTPLSTKKEYAYSDLGFILLKFAIENMTGKTLDQYCKEEFYHKLGMYDTDFQASERLNKEHIVPSCVDKLYRKIEISGSVHDPTAAMLGGIAGHAGLFSTAEDLAKMLEMYLNKGSYGGEYYFSPTTIDTFSTKNDAFPQNRRGLGFDKPEADSTKVSPSCSCAPLSSYGHTGFTGIMVWCDPTNHLLYLFLSNRTYPDEFNNKLSEENIRTKIQDIIYKAIQ